MEVPGKFWLFWGGFAGVCSVKILAEALILALPVVLVIPVALFLIYMRSANYFKAWALRTLLNFWSLLLRDRNPLWNSNFLSQNHWWKKKGQHLPSFAGGGICCQCHFWTNIGIEMTSLFIINFKTNNCTHLEKGLQNRPVL